MTELTSSSAVRGMLARHDFRLKKSLGQNFLMDQNIVVKIIQAAGLTGADLVMEIGPGLGTMTKQMAALAGQVIAVEVDRTLLPILAETLPQDKVQVVNADALQVDFDRLAAEATGGEFGPGGKSYKLLANLPYYITTPLVMHLLTNRFNLQVLVIMIQKEVADRLQAAPGGKDYGSLSVAVQYYTIPEIVCRVPRTVFYPAPEVDSTVIKLTVRDQPPVQVLNEQDFFTVVRASFAQRRKTILNSLFGSGLGRSKEQWLKTLTDAGIDPGRRGETLSLEEFASLANCYSQK